MYLLCGRVKAYDMAQDQRETYSGTKNEDR